jgi:hypothetical protein
MTRTAITGGLVRVRKTLHKRCCLDRRRDGPDCREPFPTCKHILTSGVFTTAISSALVTPALPRKLLQELEYVQIPLALMLQNGKNVVPSIQKNCQPSCQLVIKRGKIEKMFNIKKYALLICLYSLGLAPLSVSADNILTYGNYPSISSLNTTLTSLGHTVTTQATLPADLSPYDTIWNVTAFTPLSGADQTALAAFLAAGGGIHLTGERPCCETLNDSLEAFVNSVVVAGGIQVGDLGDIGGSFTINPSAAGDLATLPNAVSVWVPSASGGMGGLGSLPAANILVTGSGDVPVGAVWTEGDLVSGGRLTLLMDVNWFSNPGGGDNAAFTENIERFLAAATATAISVSPAVPIPMNSSWALLLLTLLMLAFAGIKLGRPRS